MIYKQNGTIEKHHGMLSEIGNTPLVTGENRLQSSKNTSIEISYDTIYQLWNKRDIATVQLLPKWVSCFVPITAEKDYLDELKKLAMLSNSPQIYSILEIIKWASENVYHKVTPIMEYPPINLKGELETIWNSNQKLLFLYQFDFLCKAISLDSLPSLLMGTIRLFYENPEKVQLDLLGFPLLGLSGMYVEEPLGTIPDSLFDSASLWKIRDVSLQHEQQVHQYQDRFTENDYWKTSSELLLALKDNFPSNDLGIQKLFIDTILKEYSDLITSSHKKTLLW